MRITVDFDRCQSNGKCMLAAPTVFEVREDNFLYVLQDEPGPELHKAVHEAAARCPTQAITVED
jgi:ferredoxin